MNAALKGFLWTVLVVGALVGACYASVAYLNGLCCLGMSLFLVLIAAAVIGAIPATLVELFFAKVIRRPRGGLIGFCTVFGAVYLALLVPHLQMTHQMIPLAHKFDQASHADHREYQSEDPDVVVADFGGALDGITVERDDALRARQYLGFFGWHYKDGSTQVGMLYLYTYLPKATFDRWFPDPLWIGETENTRGRG